jgi:hypothetical protein
VKKIALLILILLPLTGYAGDDLKIAGMPSVAFNKDNGYFNFGGPSVKIECGDNFGGFSFFPSLRHNNVTDEWSPILGAGVYAGRGNVFLIMPNYYYNSNWYGAFGIGYKF